MTRSVVSDIQGMYWGGNMGETYEHPMNTFLGSSVDIV
jgi:hypothetical protein